MKDATIIVDPTPEQLVDERLQAVFGYWLSLKSGGGLPRKADFDPLTIHSALSHVMLIDACDQGGLTYRLIGTAIVAKMGRDCTGLSVPGSYAGDDWDDVEPTYHLPLKQRCPVLVTNMVHSRGDNFHYLYRRLLCPMTRGSGTPDLLLGALSFDWVSAADIG